jgi:hypothetical protein
MSVTHCVIYVLCPTAGWHPRQAPHLGWEGDAHDAGVVGGAVVEDHLERKQHSGEAHCTRAVVQVPAAMHGLPCTLSMLQGYPRGAMQADSLTASPTPASRVERNIEPPTPVLHVVA